MYADVRTKIFRINGLPNLLTHGAPRAPLAVRKLGDTSKAATFQTFQRETKDLSKKMAKKFNDDYRNWKCN